MDNIFEYRDWLDNHDKNDSSYKYYEQKYNARKQLLSVFWAPFFAEIKWKTGGIQQVLKNIWYENIEWSLKSLIIDWIKFFLHLDYQIRINDNIQHDAYFLWLFDSLKINTKNKKLLNDILLELQNWWENLPESPINVLVDYYNKLDKTKLEQPKLEKAEKTKPIKIDHLQRIIDDFRKKDYGFIKDLRTVWVKENKLEYTFLIWLHRDITKLLRGENISNESIDKIFNYYNIDIYDRQLLSILKNELEWRFPDLNWKEIMSWHCSFNDSPHWLELYGENVVKYKIWDEYIPTDNCCAREVWKIDPYENQLGFNIVWSYDNWDRFTVVKPTYSEYIKYDADRIKCRFVHIHSKNTWKTYRALSE